MPGLLDFLQTPDAQFGLGLLAAAGPSTQPMSAGQRVAAALQGVQAQKDAELKRQYVQSQIAENTSQDAIRRQQLAQAQRKLDMQQGLLGYPTGGGAAAPAASTGSLAASSTTGGAPSPETPVGTPRGPMTLQQISQQYQIPYESLAFDLVQNDGKGIAEMVFKRGAPNMKVTNGYAYDENRIRPGFLPGLNTSQDGKSTLTLVDPATGLPRVMPTPGAVDSYGAFQEVGNRSAAQYQPETVIDPATGQKVLVPRADVLQPRVALPGRPLGAAGPGYAGGSAASASGGQRDILEAELGKAQQEQAAAAQAGDGPRAARAQQDVAALQRELQRLPGGRPAAPLIGPGAGATAAPAAGNVVELSPQQQAENDAAKTKMVDTARADVVRDTGRSEALKRSTQIREISTLASNLLDKGPTASGIGALVDSAANFVGQPLKSGTVAQQLEALSGWMVSNVPRMEGPQSNMDVLNYTTMAGRVGDRTLPIEARKAALRTVIELQDKYAELNGGAPAAPARGMRAAAPASAAAAAPALPPGWTVKVK